MKLRTCGFVLGLFIALAPACGGDDDDDADAAPSGAADAAQGGEADAAPSGEADAAPSGEADAASDEPDSGTDQADAASLN